jgi:hypothetical protein
MVAKVGRACAELLKDFVQSIENQVPQVTE